MRERSFGVIHELDGLIRHGQLALVLAQIQSGRASQPLVLGRVRVVGDGLQVFEHFAPARFVDVLRELAVAERLIELTSQMLA